MRRRRGGVLRFFFMTGRLVDAVVEYYWSPLTIDVDISSSCNCNHSFHDLQPFACQEKVVLCQLRFDDLALVKLPFATICPA